MGDHDCYVTAQVLLSDPHIVLDPPFDYLEFKPKTAKKKKKKKFRDRGCFFNSFSSLLFIKRTRQIICNSIY